MTILTMVPISLRFLFNHYAQKFPYNFALKVKQILIVAKLEYEVRRILIMHSEA